MLQKSEISGRLITLLTIALSAVSTIIYLMIFLNVQELKTQFEPSHTDTSIFIRIYLDGSFFILFIGALSVALGVFATIKRRMPITKPWVYITCSSVNLLLALFLFVYQPIM